MELTNAPLAHLTEDGQPHLLSDHLAAVGEGAARFAEPFGAGASARLAGLWHDLGKYSRSFQKMIREANGFAAHIEGDATGPRDHSTAGAVHAARALKGAGQPIAFAIAGHHAGLSNSQELIARLQSKASCLDLAKQGGAPDDLLATDPIETPAHLKGSSPEQQRRREMWTRMLFSALCDADFLDTEAFYDATAVDHGDDAARRPKSALRGGGPSIAELASRLAHHLDALEAAAPPTEVNRVRAEVRRACVVAATEPPGVFDLTVPTGGGKTLASLAFALAHAAHHGLRRVVVAIPFTAIIEQSAEVYRAALGREAVVEHHSALVPKDETPRSRIACENWDAPVIVTTTVQLFESLFANRPSKCRKLHRLAGSVIVLDEAQTLPPGLLEPILDGLATLVRDYGASVVISTATQPAFRRRAWLPTGFEAVRPIVPVELDAFKRLERVRVRWPTADEPTSYETLAGEIAGERDVLAIVHLRKDARALCEILDQRLDHARTAHLSALMCAEHRSRVLAGIKAQKQAGELVRLVSTQLVEAGVDVDFAVVYRALGGMDALAQAAGRCNREGRLVGLGELRVFVAPTAPPRGVPAAALGVTQILLRGDPALDLFAPATHTGYFERLYSAKDLDAKRIQEARARCDFKDVAARFQLIEDEWSAPIVVPYGGAVALVAEIERLGPSRARLRGLQRFTVNVPKKYVEGWLATGAARLVAETVVALDAMFAPAYDPRFGLVCERVGIGSPEAFVVG